MVSLLNLHILLKMGMLELQIYLDGVSK